MNTRNPPLHPVRPTELVRQLGVKLDVATDRAIDRGMAAMRALGVAPKDQSDFVRWLCCEAARVLEQRVADRGGAGTDVAHAPSLDLHV